MKLKTSNQILVFTATAIINIALFFLIPTFPVLANSHSPIIKTGEYDLFTLKDRAIVDVWINVIFNDLPKNTLVWIEWGTTNTPKIKTDAKLIPYNVESEQGLVFRLYNLKKGVRYYYRAAAQLPDGKTIYGITRKILTPWEGADSDSSTTDTTTFTNTNTNYSTPHNSSPSQNNTTQQATTNNIVRPIATTGLASNITSDSVMIRATIIPGNPKETTFYFEWGKNPNSLSQKTPARFTTKIEVVYENIENLTPATTYYYRAVAKNSDKINYGNTFSFTTLAGTAKPTTSNTQPFPNKTREVHQTASVLNGTWIKNLFSAHSQTNQKTDMEVKQKRAINNATSKDACLTQHSFFPQTFTQWLIAIAAFLTIIALSNHLYLNHKKRVEEKDDEKKGR